VEQHLADLQHLGKMADHVHESRFVGCLSVLALIQKNGTQEKVISGIMRSDCKFVVERYWLIYTMYPGPCDQSNDEPANSGRMLHSNDRCSVRKVHLASKGIVLPDPLLSSSGEQSNGRKLLSD
jgi:hypothetical protein